VARRVTFAGAQPLLQQGLAHKSGAAVEAAEGSRAQPLDAAVVIGSSAAVIAGLDDPWLLLIFALAIALNALLLWRRGWTW
jgi:hypothetical protein